MQVRVLVQVGRGTSRDTEGRGGERERDKKRGCDGEERGGESALGVGRAQGSLSGADKIANGYFGGVEAETRLVSPGARGESG